MSELMTAVNNLLKRHKTDTALPCYVKELKGLYRDLSFLKLSMNFYTFSEIYCELDNDNKVRLADDIAVLIDLIGKIVNDVGFDDSDKMRISRLRESVATGTETLTAFVDRFEVCEYMLNRVEYRFYPCKYDMQYYNTDFEKDILAYITRDRDNALINTRISLMSEQLPMRLSSNKFFDILMNSLSLYKGSDKLSLYDFEYMIRTTGLLKDTDDEAFPLLTEAYARFADSTFETLDKEQYDELRKKLDEVTEYTEKTSDAYVIIAEVINDLYTVILTDDKTAEYENASEKSIKVHEGLKKMILLARNSICEDKPHAEGTSDAFSEFEGMQEELNYSITSPENALDEIMDIHTDDIKKLGFEEDFKDLTIIKKLQSTSTFARLTTDETFLNKVDETDVDKVLEGLKTDFTELFKDKPRLFKRAVMAGVIGNLPVFFGSLEEFKEYVHITLLQCNDEAERCGCMASVRMIIKGD